MGLQFIGIDIGTSTISGIIFDPETRNIRSITKKNISRLESENDWEDLQDPQIIVAIVKEILDEFIAEYDSIKGIGITGQMHGILYADQSGNPIGPLYTWQDGRGDLLYQEDLTYAQFLSKITGYAVASGYGLVTHFYNVKNNLVSGNRYKICTIMDYVVMKLSGQSIPVIDNSNAASLGFYDLQNFRFDLDALNKVSLNPDVLPEILPSGQIIGYYEKEVFVCNPIGDNQASFLGAVNEIENSALVNIGTSSQVSIYTDQYIRNDFLELRPFPGGGYILVGSALCGGYSLVILKNFYEEVIKMFCDKPCEEIGFYDVFNSLRYSKKNADESLNVEVLFRGTRMNPQKRGIIKNISTVNFTPVNMIFGFLNGICNELYDFYEQIPEKRRNKIKRIVGSGNAIRINKLLCSMVEERFGNKMVIPENYEQAAFGACLCAMVCDKRLPAFAISDNL